MPQSALGSVITPETLDAPMAPTLEAIRRHLGMEVAYISEFVGDLSMMREVSAPGLEHLIKPGDALSLDDVYCRHIVAGRLPELIADTAAEALCQTLPITRNVPIGAHMSVPIRLADGELYGMFCCLSPTPNHSLNPRDLQVMRVFADLAAHQIDRERARDQEANALRDRILQVIEGREFEFHYQPIFTFAPFRLVGFEALCRFHATPYRTPDIWFAEAEASDLAEPLELAAAARALEALADLPDPLFVSVNLAPATLLGGRFREALGDWPCGRVIIEVTEHAPVSDYAALNAAIAPLRAAGVRLAVDDAGSGFASLQHIIQLEPDIIKLDVELTRGLDSDTARRALVAALTYFARETGTEIVAEGVETEAERQALEALQVRKGQGYLLGRPMPRDAAMALAARLA
ncbi:sensor domain-containing phosphodiesterase [Roseococcus microcysteis]|uniref:sensor domain-containing phosphodiesterase n=1 Tax=Roseococcus microcysteis TaxID=2771361 RepID=UPI001CC4549E|nr:EAL domain-containing protein [Roseococcus microcysteis]